LVERIVHYASENARPFIMPRSIIPSISNSLTLEVCLSAPDNSGTGTFYIKAGRWTFTGIGHNASTQCVGTEADLKKALSQMTVALVEMNAGRLSF
jgi:hypothetical protein